MKKSIIWLLVVIMALTFSGLLYLQISYMDTMMKMRNEQFNEAVKRSLYRVSKSLEWEETRRYLDEEVEESQKEFLSSLAPNEKADIEYEHRSQFSVMNPDGTISNLEFKDYSQR